MDHLYFSKNGSPPSSFLRIWLICLYVLLKLARANQIIIADKAVFIKKDVT